MAVTSSCNEERAEVEAVLKSGIFVRAHNLESFFRYVCERHLCGQAEQLKEYNIAVEAFGRAPQFDQKKDSIVRVEAHRLRKRLSEYYAGPGAGHKIHISIPLGSYAPQFVLAEPDQAPSASEIVSIAPTADLQQIKIEPVPLDSEPIPAALNPSRWASVRFRWLFILFTIAFIVGVIAWRILPMQTAAARSANEVWLLPAEGVVPAEFRMLAGHHGQPLHDVQGHDWQPDAYYSGGTSVTLPPGLPIQGVPVCCLITSARMGKFQYDIPVREGNYEVHLSFAETEYGIGNPKGGGDASRLFRLTINGKSKVDLFDVHAEAGGPNRLFVRVFKDVSRSADGKIHLGFEPITGMAFVNAIEILPSAPGRIRPIRIVAQDHAVTDADGQVWSADEYVVGGATVLRHDARFQDRNFALFQGERYGNFSYHLPLAPGKYRLTLHFAETYFGTPIASSDAQGHRLFDIYANGVALVRKFDVLKEAGGPNRGVEKVFEDLEPNAQGELNLQFVPLENYAEVNALEVVETD